MDPQISAKRKRPASARQRLKATSASQRRRHTQQPTSGGASGRRPPARPDAPERTEQAEQGRHTQFAQNARDAARDAWDTHWPDMRERVTTGASATFTTVADTARRVSRLRPLRSLPGRNRDPLARGATWIVEPSWYERIHNWLADAVPFGLRERARRRGFWRRRIMPLVAILACLALAFGVGVFALRAAGHAAGTFTSNVNPPQATPGGAVMIAPANGPSSAPTPPAVQYTLGVWVSNTLPQGGSVTVFMRVSNNTQPQPDVKVSLVANTPGGSIALGPFTTDSYGLASTTLNYGNVGSQQPIFLTATTSVDGQTITGQYTFVTY